MFIPINFDNMHWVCGELDLIGWRLSVYDSGVQNFSDKEVSDFCAGLTQGLPWLLQSSSYYTDSGRPQRVDPLQLIRIEQKAIPQQLPGSGDCGVFTCKFIEYLSSGRPFNFEGENINFIRQCMGVELWCRKLL